MSDYSLEMIINNKISALLDKVFANKITEFDYKEQYSHWVEDRDYDLFFKSKEGEIAFEDEAEEITKLHSLRDELRDLRECKKIVESAEIIKNFLGF